jgi:hypothetical protein
MFVWALVIIVVLLIPILAIVLDSQIGKAIAERLSSGRAPEDVQARLESLEGEVRYLTATLEELREETTFVRSLVEGRRDGSATPRLGPRPPAEGGPPDERVPPSGE